MIIHIFSGQRRREFQYAETGTAESGLSADFGAAL